MKRLTLAVSLTMATLLAACVSPPRLFERNAELKARGFYMAEFEFKMMAALDQLNAGNYWAAYGTLRRIQDEVESTDGLVKVPERAAPDTLIDFLLERQNPETGAFMNPGYPYFTYIGPTANVVDHLDDLGARTGRTVRLRHPLRFLDAIRTPDRLRAYLDAYLYFDPDLAEKFDAPAPYVAAVSELTGNTLDQFERIGGYQFAPGWRDALDQWFYETQDPATGVWGARLGTPDAWRQSLDIDSTSHILKHFLDMRGQPRDPRYPLRHAEPPARLLVQEASVSLPEDADAQHEWSLRQAHAAKIITRWLWPVLPTDLRAQALTAMSGWLDARFALYRPTTGGFAVGAADSQADIDATTTALGFLVSVGYVPGTWQRERLRADALAVPPGATRAVVTRGSTAAVPLPAGVNSVRVYADEAPSPESLDDATLVQILYPRPTPVPDVMALRQGVARYMAEAGGEFGNWTSKAGLAEKPLGFDRAVRAVPSSTGPLCPGCLAAGRPDVKRLVVVGVDRFQVPVLQQSFELVEAVLEERPRPVGQRAIGTDTTR